VGSSSGTLPAELDEHMEELPSATAAESVVAGEAELVSAEVEPAAAERVVSEESGPDASEPEPEAAQSGPALADMSDLEQRTGEVELLPPSADKMSEGEFCMFWQWQA